MEQKVLLWNVNGSKPGKNSSTKGHAKLRKELLKYGVNETNPSFALLQETKQKDYVSSLELNNNYRYFGKKDEAGIIFNSDIYSYVGTEEFSSKIFPKEINDRIFGLNLKNQIDGNSILVYSAHAPHRLKKEKKVEFIEKLFEGFKEVQKHYQIPVLLGGDFNLNLGKEEVDLKGFSISKYQSNRKYNQIDFCTYLDPKKEIKSIETTPFKMFGENINDPIHIKRKFLKNIHSYLKEIQTEDYISKLGKNYSKYWEFESPCYFALDHDPLLTTFSFKNSKKVITMFDDNKKQIEVPTSSKKKPHCRTCGKPTKGHPKKCPLLN